MILLFMIAVSVGPLILGVFLISVVIGISDHLLDSFVTVVLMLTLGFLGLMFLAASWSASRAIAYPSHIRQVAPQVRTDSITRWVERWMIRWMNRAFSVSYQTEASTALALYVAVEFLVGAFLVFIGISNLVFDVKGFDWGLVALTVFGLLVVTDSLLLYRRGFKQIARFRERTQILLL